MAYIHHPKPQTSEIIKDLGPCCSPCSHILERLGRAGHVSTPKPPGQTSSVNLLVTEWGQQVSSSSEDVSPFTTEIVVTNHMQTPVLIVEAKHHGEATPAHGVEHSIPPGGPARGLAEVPDRSGAVGSRVQ